MRVEWHALSALPFALAGQWWAVAGCLLPDVTLAATELAIRRGAAPRDVLTPQASPVTWRFYEAAHAPLLALALAAWWPWLAVGLLVHVALDVPSHWGPWRPNLRWPLPATRRPAGRRVVPLSGGWDSVACLARAAADGTDGLVACFVDYGQPFAPQERAAAAYAAGHFGVPVEEATTRRPLPFLPGGTIAGRNRRIFKILRDRYGAEATVYFGTRNALPWLDRHGDSNVLWARRTAAALGLRVRTPVACWPKAAVGRRLRGCGVEPARLYSTER